MKLYRIGLTTVCLMPLFILFILDVPQNANVQAQRQNQDSRFFGLTLSTDPIQNAAFVAAGALAVGAGVAAGAWITNHFNSKTTRRPWHSSHNRPHQTSWGCRSRHYCRGRKKRRGCCYGRRKRNDGSNSDYYDSAMITNGNKLRESIEDVVDAMDKTDIQQCFERLICDIASGNDDFSIASPMLTLFSKHVAVADQYQKKYSQLQDAEMLGRRSKSIQLCEKIFNCMITGKELNDMALSYDLSG